MQNFTLHSHTNFGQIFDGRNSAEEMISQAENLGFEKIGISNHLIYHHNLQETQPMIFADAKRAIDVYQQNIEDIRTAASQHKIKVLIGFEVDYFSSSKWRDAFEKILSAIKYDYLIGAVHNLSSADGEDIINLYDVFWFDYREKQSLIPSYFPNVYDTLISAIKSSYFDFMAHLDIYKIFNLGNGQEWEKEKLRIIDALGESKLPTELNTSGWNKCGEQNPDEWMLRELNKRHVPLFISDDAHAAIQIGQHFKRAENLLSQIGYKNRWDL